MSKKIYLSPSNQDGNMYAYGNTNEMEQCNRIAEATKKALERCGFIVKKAPKGQPMKTTISESNAWKPDLHICIHTNAGGGAGTMCMVYDKDPNNMKYAKPIYETVQAVTIGKTDYGVRCYPQLAELNATTSVAVYTEIDFHDDKNIAKWLIENTTTIGEAFAKGICKGFGVEYKPIGTPKTANKKILYKVQVGAYTEKNNAEIILKKLKELGYKDAFITIQGG